MINKFFKKAGGFTLIETLVAVLLLSMAISGPLTIAAKGLSTSLIAKDQVGAYYLGQDAIEYLRFVRDSNKLGGTNWLAGTTNLTACEGATGCYVDSVQSTVTACSAPACPVINYDSANHYYSYTTGTPSQQRYIRTVKLVTPVGTNSSEVTAVVTVQWTAAGGATHTVTVQEDMFDWQ